MTSGLEGLVVVAASTSGAAIYLISQLKRLSNVQPQGQVVFSPGRSLQLMFFAAGLLAFLTIGAAIPLVWDQPENPLLELLAYLAFFALLLTVVSIVYLARNWKDLVDRREEEDDKR
ncbi:MAG: hypothetical protein NT137_03650 [Methanomassiliicoccales archaeon]|nr:hypothetical protein [Methanomassiliicoccales archaeon]